MVNIPNQKINLQLGDINGAKVLAKCLKTKGVEVMFGIVGIPVVEVAEACISEGIQFIGCRNEQTASYAAGAYGYLTGKVGVCLVVSGPGVVHALSGLFNAQANCWPLILIGGSCERNQVGMGAFQELDQVFACKQYTKYSDRPNSIQHIPEVVDRAFNITTVGQPGTSYIDLPADLIKGIIKEKEILNYPKLNKLYTIAGNEEQIELAIKLLSEAKKPLVILGKGAAYSQSEKEIQYFIENSQLPFITSPMGKGILSDDHPNCASSARSFAIKNADVILVIGARLNWMFQYGRQFQPLAKLIQIDINAEEMGKSKIPDICLVGHIQTIIKQMNLKLKVNNSSKEFLNQIQQLSIKNNQRLESKFKSNKLLMNHHQALKVVQHHLNDLDCCLISEGARTMDVTRVLIPSKLPRHRLDAGTLGVMGVGVGYAITAQLVYPEKKVIAIMGDSAFGFSALDVETCLRYNLPIIFIIINNSGIYSGLSDLSNLDKSKIPSFALSPSTEYHHIAKLVPNKAYGVTVDNKEDLNLALEKAIKGNQLAIINVIIDPAPAEEGLYWEIQDKNSKL